MEPWQCHEYRNFSKRQTAFLIFCQWIAKEYANRDDIMRFEIKRKCPFGGIIGQGKSRLDKYLSWSKVIRLHAIMHDAFGFMKATYDIGPGYSYVVKVPFNSCYLGHVPGILLVIGYKLFSREFYNSIDI